jgi:hypothetical protein
MDSASSRGWSWYSARVPGLVVTSTPSRWPDKPGRADPSLRITGIPPVADSRTPVDAKESDGCVRSTHASAPTARTRWSFLGEPELWQLGSDRLTR